MKQQGVSYSINYVFTCGKRRVRICRNIYDQTNNTNYLVEEGSNGISGGVRNEELSGKQNLFQQQGVCEGQKKNSTNCFGGNRIKGEKWVISSQKQLLLVGSNNPCEIEEKGRHGSLMEDDEKNRKRGVCMKNCGQGQNLKKCECIECISNSKFNLSSSSTTSSLSFKEGKENSSYISSSSQNSVQNLRLITDFYLHLVSEVHGVLQSNLLLRVEDTFFDLDDNTPSNMNRSTTNKTYAYNKRILNGFLFKNNGLYMQFPSTHTSMVQTAEKIPSSQSHNQNSSYYPNSTDLTLKNDNFQFRFVVIQTDEGFSVDGTLSSSSQLHQASEQLAYNVSILQQQESKEEQHFLENPSIQSLTPVQTQNRQSHVSFESSKHFDLSQQKKQQMESEDEEDTQSSSLTIQINNNNRYEYHDDANYNQSKKNKNSKESTKRNSQKKTPQLCNTSHVESDKKLTKKHKKQSGIQSDDDEELNQYTEKKCSSVSKKNSQKSHKSTQSTSCEEEDNLSKHTSSTKYNLNSKRSYFNDEIDEEFDGEQHSWDSHSKISTQSHHKNFHNQSLNEELNSSQNNNAPVQPKKNVVKNFVKAFRNFVNNWGDERRIMQAIGISTHEELQNFRLEYKKYESMHKFNNTFIKALILNEPFKPVFNYFVNEVAWEWLDKSQVNNKKAHKDVLRDYVKATKDPLRIEEIHSLRTRNRQSQKKQKSQ